MARRLLAPSPAWHRRVDVVVVGSGVAGLSAALAVAGRARVLVVTKGGVDAGATAWAQGGIAAAVGPGDHPDAHAADTLAAAAGLADRAAVRILVDDGAEAIARLIALGARFDGDGGGELGLAREGGHGRARVVHAGGDATGHEVQRALGAATERAGVEVLDGAFAVDAVRAGSRVAGVVVAVPTADGGESIGLIEARAVILAAGGIGQVYASSTNPPVATGDGLAIALRAGASLADVEFVQFHPTVLWSGPGSRGQQALVSEAVRGEGAVLIDATGARVMDGAHPLGDLAPRDVVARRMAERMAHAPGGVADYLFLDARPVGGDVLEARFPTLVARCRNLGVDPAHEPIPVAPAAHFACGGVATDGWGRSDVPGLYAVGEVAATGVHGANRLASNSLLEGLVFGARVGAHVVAHLPPPADPDEADEADRSRGAACRSTRDRAWMTPLMSEHAALGRQGAGLETAAGALAASPAVPDGPPTRADWEATNIHAVATVIVDAAHRRTESRGCHWRTDFPHPDGRWRRRLVVGLGDDGSLRLRPTAAQESAA